MLYHVLKLHTDSSTSIEDIHKMFTVFPKVTLDWRLSRYQGLE